MSAAWHKVPKSTRTGAASLAPLFLWYKAEKTAREMTDAERKNDLITELDVTYGEDIPWYGFDRLSPPTTPEIKDRRQSVYITFRRGVKRKSLAKPLSLTKQPARPPSRSPPAFLPRWQVPYPPSCRLTLLCLPRRLSRHHYLPMRGLRQPHLDPPCKSSRCRET